MIFVKIEVRLQTPLDNSVWGGYHKHHIFTEAPEGDVWVQSHQQGRTEEYQSSFSHCVPEAARPHRSHPRARKGNQSAEPRIQDHKALCGPDVQLQRV